MSDLTDADRLALLASEAGRKALELIDRLSVANLATCREAALEMARHDREMDEVRAVLRHCLVVMEHAELSGLLVRPDNPCWEHRGTDPLRNRSSPSGILRPPPRRLCWGRGPGPLATPRGPAVD